MSGRRPGSREEDAWLSDEQLERCAPAESDDFQSPVPTRMISNGEYMPYPQTQKQQRVEARIKELAGSGGMAAAFLAMNEAFGSEFFKVDRDEMFEPDAHARGAPPKDLFVFDT